MGWAGEGGWGGWQKGAAPVVTDGALRLAVAFWRGCGVDWFREMNVHFCEGDDFGGGGGRDGGI